MNELSTSSPYDPDTYHIAQTHSLFVRLDQYKLRLSRPKQNIPRRAMWDEQIHKPEFIHQRHYDMRGSKVRCDCWSPLKLPVCEIAPVEAQTEYTQACHVGRTDP